MIHFPVPEALTFDDVLLVGGMTIMPAITQTLKERFGLQARQQDPHLAVAKGAALFALMRKVKVSMPGEDGSAQEVADQRRRRLRLRRFG